MTKQCRESCVPFSSSLVRPPSACVLDSIPGVQGMGQGGWAKPVSWGLLNGEEGGKRTAEGASGSSGGVCSCVSAKSVTPLSRNPPKRSDLRRAKTRASRRCEAGRPSQELMGSGASLSPGRADHLLCGGLPARRVSGAREDPWSLLSSLPKRCPGKEAVGSSRLLGAPLLVLLRSRPARGRQTEGTTKDSGISRPPELCQK
ncbi:hypothetical protein HPG69_008335 [Diceros bicornis minor]|uniref:Uncharacterized protein n=1 Tax=Diceros bicornis minor TaxID=77932 RepID=A0A7J7ENI8_DICBM|nr:hypothetical protein HPG69_008335 [Diceros bicornis minor]